MKPAVRTTLQVLAFALLAALSIYLLPQFHYYDKYDYEVGTPWKHELLQADFTFSILKDSAAYEEELAEITSGFVPIFNHRPSVEVPEEFVMTIDDKERMDRYQWKTIDVCLADNTSRKISLAEVKINASTEAYLYFNNKVVNPTLVFDSVKTFESIGVLQQSISWTEGEVVEGAKIVDRGEIVTPEIERKIRSMQKALMQTELETSEFYSYLTGSGVCIIFLLLLFFFYLYVYRRKLLDDMRNVLFFTIMMGIVIAVSYMLLSYAKNVEYIYFIPFVWVPVITRVFYDSRTAIFLHIITVSVVSIGMQTPYHFLLIQLVAGIVSVVSLRDMTQRAQLATTASFVFLTYSLLYTAFCLMQNASWESLLNINWMYYIYFAVNAVLVVCAYGLIFLFERSFGLLSSITLVELTNVNSNLMLQFAEQAPGTFQHSMQVSNLATEAAKRIGAKVLLVRTGALYHDIGKMSHPEYFIENQAGGYNPLLEMTNEQAARVIIDHVKEGERIARKHKLPEVIIHFILSHHGDSQTRYFYNTAINEAKQAGLDPSTVNAADYTYPGPRPTTKEAAILTIADAVEARSRSLKEMTPQSISDMVDDMVDILIRDGQLSETPLSFKDLEEIRKVFKQKLMEINHHRITYPTVE